MPSIPPPPLSSSLPCPSSPPASPVRVLSEKVREVLRLDEEMKELARELQNEQSLLVFGRGYNYATAIEAALKVR